MQKVENTKTPLKTMYLMWGELVCAVKENINFSKQGDMAFIANILKDIYAMDFEGANFDEAKLVARGEILYSTSDENISAVVEAVQIEWISNGILVPGKSAEGAFCNYYRDTSQFINQSVGGKAIQFVNDKAPKVGDTCILYFGMSESASE